MKTRKKIHVEEIDDCRSCKMIDWFSRRCLMNSKPLKMEENGDYVIPKWCHLQDAE